MEKHIKEGAEVALHLKTDRKLRERGGEGGREGEGGKAGHSRDSEQDKKREGPHTPPVARSHTSFQNPVTSGDQFFFPQVIRPAGDI